MVKQMIETITYDVQFKPNHNPNIATAPWRTENTFDTLADAIRYASYIADVGRVKIIETRTLINEITFDKI